MRFHRKHYWTALVVAAVLATAACGSSDDDDPPGGDASASVEEEEGGTTRGVTATEIKVAGMGATPSFFTDANLGLGARARFARANEEGEIPGNRKITMVEFADDKADPATNVQETRRLVQREGVFAIVPAGTVVFQNTPEQTHTPVFGYGISPSFCTAGGKSYFFGFNGCVVPPNPDTAGDNSIEMMEAAITEGIVDEGSTPKIAIIGPDNPVGQRAVAIFAASSKGNGMEVVYAKAPTPAPPAVVGDYSPYVADVLATDPDIITSVGVFSDYVGIGKALQAANYKGMYIIPAADPALAKAIGPSYAWTTWAPPESASTTPAIQQMLDDIEAFEPGTAPGTLVQAGWLAADHFVQALQEVGEDLTAEKLQRVAAKMTYHREGLIGPHSYPKNWEYTAPACHSVTKTDGVSGTYTVVLPYSCSADRYPIKPYDEIVTP